MKYIIIILFSFINCKSSNCNENLSNISISFEGNIDKALPEIIFCENCKEINDFKIYKFKMDNNFFISIKKISSLVLYNKQKNNTSFISVIINNNEKFFLNKKDSIIFIKELITVSQQNKNNQTITNQLSKFLKIIEKK